MNEDRQLNKKPILQLILYTLYQYTTYFNYMKTLFMS